MSQDRGKDGRFLPGNRISSHGGRARARKLSAEQRQEIARSGFKAMVERWFNGDRDKAKEWLVNRGLWSQDTAAREYNYQFQFSDPGEHPARRKDT